MPRIRAKTIAQHKQLVRSRLLDAAEQSFAAYGYEGSSLGGIADLADIPRSTFYEYFSSKQDLLLALISERVPPLLEEWFAGVPEAGPMERLEGIFRSTYEMTLRYPQLTSVVVGAGRKLPDEVQLELWPKVGGIVATLIRTCRAAIDDGLFPGGDPTVLGMAVAQLLVGGVEDLLRHEDPDAIVDSVLDTRLRMLRHGIAGGVRG